MANDELRWTTEKPTEPGWYWVYATPLFEDEPTVACMDVHIIERHISFDYPVDGYEWEPLIEARDVIAWMGPLRKPDPPGFEPERSHNE